MSEAQVPVPEAALAADPGLAAMNQCLESNLADEALQSLPVVASEMSVMQTLQLSELHKHQLIVQHKKQEYEKECELLEDAQHEDCRITRQLWLIQDDINKKTRNSHLLHSNLNEYLSDAQAWKGHVATQKLLHKQINTENEKYSKMISKFTVKLQQSEKHDPITEQCEQLENELQQCEQLKIDQPEILLENEDKIAEEIHELNKQIESEKTEIKKLADQIELETMKNKQMRQQFDVAKKRNSAQLKRLKRQSKETESLNKHLQDRIQHLTSRIQQQ
ncbi:uncharacterized protein LOC141905263 [Tubulanus polymorphus]|uniref:uncharacterized protein LOC141905263 n=1 Tax=Tubulanus polymorphus TaxID=672921 RepID=UPI003DA5E262